jgi:glycosyltransferase involved in cell wall biosynthesis
MSIRVLEVIPTLKRAGAENMAASLACLLDKSRFEIAVASLYDAFPNGLEPLLGRHGVPVRHLGKRRGFDPRMYPRLSAVRREFRPHIVHTHSYVLRYVLPVFARRGTAIVHTVHNIASKEAGRLGQAIHRYAFRHGVTPVAIAGELARSVRALYDVEPETIPNGVDAAAFHRPEARLPWRQANGFQPDDILILSAARLDPQKNPLALLEAFALAAAGESRCRLLLAGGGSLLEAARERAARLGVAGSVHFLGVREDMPELLNACDIFALASDWEGHPLSVMEAMAAGLPVAATAAGGVPEIVEDGATGLLVPPGDIASFAAALQCLVRNPLRRRELGGAARAASARFDSSAMASAYSALFERLARTAQ